MQTHRNKHHFLHLDQPLLWSLVLLSCLGLIILYSASAQNFDMIIRQILRLVTGFGLMLWLAQINLQKLRSWIPWLYMIGVVLLVLVLVIGESSKGSIGSESHDYGTGFFSR